MKRIVLLLAVLFCLQTTWLLVVSSCMPEPNTQMRHDDDHARVSADSAHSTPVWEAQFAEASDSDCTGCNGADTFLSVTVLLLDSIGQPHLAASRGVNRLPTPPISRPERPNWTALA